jgi:hypothetical protein
MSTTQDRVTQAVRDIFEFGAARPAQFSLADIRQQRPRRWTHRAVVVAVAAAILVVFFVPLPHMSLFNHVFSGGSSKTSPTASSQVFPPPRTVAVFEADAWTASRSSYMATYRTQLVDGSIVATTVARRGDQAMWLVKPLGRNSLQQEFIQFDRHTVSCQADNEGPWSCQSPSTVTGSPSWALTFLQTLPIPSTLSQPHETFRLAQQRVGGRKVTCLYQGWTDTGGSPGSETSEWCINSSGIFTYVDSVTGAAGPKHIISTLVSWSRSVPEALFNEPTTPVAPGRPWSQAPLVTVSGTAAPVQLPGTPYAYAVASFPVTESSSAERLVRIDLADGRVTTGPAVASGSFLLSVGRSVALFSPARYSARKGPSGPETLRLVQGSSMTLGRGVVVPAPSLGYQTTLVNPALANHGLWYQVGSGKEIALVDTLTGTVLRSMRFSSTVMSVVSSPGGEEYVYVTFDGTDLRTKPPAGAIVVEELDASSLKVLARQYIDGEFAGLATAVPGGVWVANSGGMEWSQFLYLSPKLSQVVRKPLFPFPSGTVPTLDGVVTQGDSAQVFGSSVFLVGSAGASCDNPSTGLFIAGASFPELSGGGFESWDLFAAWHGLLYGVRFAASGLSFEILRIQPPAACRA